MSDNGKKIMALINDKGKNATEVTKALKEIGTGYMQNGLREIAKYSENRGRKMGEKKGRIQGTVTTTIVLLVGNYIFEKYKKNKMQKELEDREKFEIQKKLVTCKRNKIGEKELPRC